MQNCLYFVEFSHSRGSSSGAIAKRDISRHEQVQRGMFSGIRCVFVYRVGSLGSLCILSVCDVLDMSTRLILGTCQVDHFLQCDT